MIPDAYFTARHDGPSPEDRLMRAVLGLEPPPPMRIAYSIIQGPTLTRWTLQIMPDGVSWTANATTATTARASMARMVRAWRRARRIWRTRTAPHA